MKLQKYRIKSLYDNKLDYRNSWGIIIFNTGDDVFEIAQGDRIAQAILTKVEKAEWNVCEDIGELKDTVRGLGGFGSTGIKN